MKEAFIKFYHLFDWANGDNTFAEFSIALGLVLILAAVEIHSRVKNKKSLFF